MKVRLPFARVETSHTCDAQPRTFTPSVRSASGNGVDVSIGTYTGLAVDEAMLEGGAAGLYVNSFWIDGDDHWNCKKAIVSAAMVVGYGSNWIYCGSK